MDKLDRYRVFIQVAEMGSFTKAAHALELPRATVSAAVQQLETELGVRLLHRTTRQVQPTVDGLLLLERARPLLTEIESLDGLFRSQRHAASGRLRIDVPSRIARRVIAPALPAFLAQHPALEVVIGSTDRAIDLVQDGVDCAVRIGQLQDSSLVVRPLGSISLINCASPNYLRAHGYPETVAALAQHSSIGYASPTTGRESPWTYMQDGQEHSVAMTSRVVVNNAETYIASCVAGLGLIQIPRYDVRHLLKSGALVEILPQHRAAAMPVSVIYPHRRQRSHRIDAFIDWFVPLMQPHLDP